MTSVVLGILLAQTVSPLTRAHSHNDYWRPRPLIDALELGFCSVEADIFLVDGELRVGHDLKETKPGVTLTRLYLEPLAARAQQNGGRIYPKGPEFTLLVDVKRDASSVFSALRRELARFPDLISRRGQSRAVRVIVSGDRPKLLIEADGEGWMGIDGRWPDVGTGLPPALVPLISENWTHHFRWNGIGEMPAAELARLRRMVAAVHREGKRIRFWALPNTLPAFRAACDAGVDLINADRLSMLRGVLREPRPGPAGGGR